MRIIFLVRTLKPQPLVYSEFIVTTTTFFRPYNLFINLSSLLNHHTTDHWGRERENFSIRLTVWYAKPGWATQMFTFGIFLCKGWQQMPPLQFKFLIFSPPQPNPFQLYLSLPPSLSLLYFYLYLSPLFTSFSPLPPPLQSPYLQYLHVNYWFS